MLPKLNIFKYIEKRMEGKVRSKLAIFIFRQ